MNKKFEFYYLKVFVIFALVSSVLLTLIPFGRDLLNDTFSQSRILDYLILFIILLGIMFFLYFLICFFLHFVFFDILNESPKGRAVSIVLLLILFFRVVYMIIRNQG